MTFSNENSPESVLQPGDLAILSELQRSNEWLRAVLCTLARRGVAFRLAHTVRTQQILQILAPFPFYKAGQFLFDLMEWEDFMTDGPAPDVVPTALDSQSLSRISNFLYSLKSSLDSAFIENNLQPFSFEITPIGDQDQTLPLLEGGFYLYQDVVLGLFISATTTTSEH
ncbi:MAG: hypothetical protein AAGL17_00845 [Cyanobacteria bacterium J06576_12]